MHGPWFHTVTTKITMKTESLADDSVLPGYSAGYSSSQTPAEHSVNLDNKGTPWLSITVQSRANKASPHPLFYEGDQICGTVQLDLAKPDAIKSITITVCSFKHVDLNGAPLKSWQIRLVVEQLRSAKKSSCFGPKHKRCGIHL